MSVVLITGAARRLGKDMALYLARQGWDIALHHHMSRWPAEEVIRELQAIGVRAHAFKADLSNEAECRALLPQVIETMGDIDAVVNNASAFVYDIGKEFTFKRFAQHMTVNTASAVVLAQTLHEHTVKVNEALSAEDTPKQSVVVNMLDQKLWNLNHDFLSYTLSKSALKTATEMLAREFAPHVRLVGVAPGLTLPPASMVDAREFERLHQMSPLQKSSTSEEVAQTVHFALTNRALTGTCLVVDGGQHLMHLPRDFTRL